jgi:diacylglycerol kinase (ATP)
VRAIAILGPDIRQKQWEPFRLSGIDLTLNSTSTRAEAVLIFGGDGTVHHQLAFLVEAQLPALIVPSGSGNDFAQAIGIPDAKAALQVWQDFVAGRATTRTIDLGVITPIEQPHTKPAFFCCVAGAGLDSDANRRANAMPRWLRGRGGYLLAATSAILKHKPSRMQVHAEIGSGEVVMDLDESAEMAAFANAPAYGSGLRIAPAAKLDDSKLNVVFVRRASRGRLLRVAPRVLKGTHIALPEVDHAFADSLTLRSDPARDVYADGEFVCPTPVSVAVVPKALRVIVGA